jgi:hypothetical protein
LRCDLLIGLGRAQSQAGLPAHRETLLAATDLARGLADAGRLAAAALANIRISQTYEFDEARFNAVRDALAAVGPDDTTERALLLAAFGNAHDPREWEASQSLALEARAVARRVGDDATLLRVLMMTSDPLHTPERLASQVEDVQEAVALADRSGDPASRFQTRFSLLIAVGVSGDFARVDRVLTEMRVILDATPLPFPIWQMGILETALLELSGDLVGAEASAERTMEYGTRTGQPEALAVYGAVLCELRLRQGRIVELVDMLVDVADQNPSIDAVQGLVFTCLLAAGRVDEARTRFEQFRARLPTLTHNGQWLSTMRHLSGAAIDLDDRDAALAVYDELLPFSEQVMFPTAIVEGAVGLQVGRLATYLGRYDEAEDLLAAAHATHERIGARYCQTWSHLELATLCCARNADGDAARARDHVTQTLALVEEHGFDGLRPRAEALLAHLDA